MGVITPDRYPTMVFGFEPGASFWFPFGPGCARIADRGLLILCYEGYVTVGRPHNDNGFLGVVS